MRQGFSLVELSIVLVILGLLVGGVLTGQSLIRAAELRSVTTEFQKYQTAVHTFRDKYFQLPGDMNNATSFWGTMTNCGAASPSGTGVQTCNGNGDGIVGLPAAPSRTGESFIFWQHLANAGLIEGSYTGVAGGSDPGHSIAGENVPRSKLSNAAWGASYVGTGFAGDANSYDIDYLNHLRFGGASIAQTNAAVLTPEDAWNIDTKIDDGKPAFGKVIARFWNNACAAADDGTHANNDLVASYKVSDASVQCSLSFIRVF